MVNNTIFSNLKFWLIIIISSSIMICASITWIYYQQKNTSEQEILVLENIRQARVDFTKGYLHIGLSGDIKSPFKQEIGITYINQAIRMFKKSMEFEIHSNFRTISKSDKAFFNSFNQNLAAFQKKLIKWNESKVRDPKNETLLRIQFYSLEQQADRIDTVINISLRKLTVQLDHNFLITLFIAAFLLTAICIVFLSLILRNNHSNKALIESQKRLKLLADNLVNGMIYQVATSTESHRHFNYLSGAVKQLYGCTADEAIKNADLIYTRIHPDDQKAFLEAEKEAFKNNSTFKKEARVINPDGSIRWSYYVSHPNIIDGILCWDGIELDITEQKEMELELLISKKEIEEKEKKYRIVTEATKDGIWDWDLVTNQTTFSKRWLEIVGYSTNESQRELTYNDWETRIHPEDKDHVLQAIKDHIEGKKEYNVEYRHLHKSTNYRWQNAIGKAIFDEEGKPVRMIGCIRDIHNQKYAEEKLNKERNTLKNILENMSDAFVSIDKNWYYTNMNTKAGHIFGKNPKELIGKNVWEEFPEGVGQPFQLNYEKVMKEKVPIVMEEYYPPYDKWFQNSIFPTDTGIAIFFSDISIRKHTEIELIAAKEKAEESDRLKSAFLANMSHEIRTPMNGILGFSALLNEPGLEKEEQQEYIKLIQISGARMLNLIAEIIDISKIESGMMEVTIKEININDQIDFAYNLLKMDAEEKGLQLSYNSKDFDDLWILTDPEKVYGVLTNLVKNAIKYTDRGTVDFGYTIKGETVEFYIKDSGIGIPKERLATVFDRFVQVDIANIEARQGAGLGLAIAKAFVTLLGGKIWVESEFNIGSTFYFTLPLTPNHTKQQSENAFCLKNTKEIAVSAENNEPIKKLKILVADDDTISRKLILKTIASFGNQIIEAKNGKEAVQKFKENPGIDLILMDIQMPEMNGYEAAKEIRTFDKEIVIISQSAFGLTGDREKALIAGSTDYITKPINKKELIGLLKKYFGD